MQKYRLVLVTFPNGVEQQDISSVTYPATKVMDEACFSALLTKTSHIFSCTNVAFLANVSKCRVEKKPFIMIQEANDE